MVRNRSPTSISASNSSLISRFNASWGVSPGSILPPGNSHQSFHSPYPRCVAKIRPCPSKITAATTSMVFIRPKCPTMIQHYNSCIVRLASCRYGNNKIELLHAACRYQLFALQRYDFVGRYANVSRFFCTESRDCKVSIKRRGIGRNVFSVTARGVAPARMRAK